MLIRNINKYLLGFLKQKRNKHFQKQVETRQLGNLNVFKILEGLRCLVLEFMKKNQTMPII
jgi:hypothetical protein